MRTTFIASPDRPASALEIDRVFKALADPSRRELLDRLHALAGQTLAELCEGLSMTRQAVSQHLQQLEEANLVAVQWEGRAKRHYFNPVPSTRSTRAGSASSSATGSPPSAPSSAPWKETPMASERFVYVTPWSRAR